MGSGKKPIWFKFAWNISSRLLEIRVLFCRQGQCPAGSQYQDPNLFASHRLLDFFTIWLSAFLVFDYLIHRLFALLSLVKSFAHQVSYCACENPFLFNRYWQMILPLFFVWALKENESLMAMMMMRVHSEGSYGPPVTRYVWEVWVLPPRWQTQP